MRDIICDVAVIGAGTAGLNAYKTAKKAGKDVCIVERGPGGSTCTRVGCMPSKLLIAAARAAAMARTAHVFGVGVGDVTIDGAAVLARVRHQRDIFVQSVLDDYDAIPDDRRIHGSARFAAPDMLMVGDDVRIRAREIVIATGSHAVMPPALEAVKDRVHTNDTIFEIAALPATLAVLGAGPLGLELAQAFARLGVAVTVFDTGDTVGKLGDPEAEQAARTALGREMTLHLGVEVTAAPAPDGRAMLRWTGASAGELAVEMILAATGRPPNLDGLDLDKAGIALDDHGVPCFDHATHRAGAASIFVAGDVGTWRPVLHEASRGGRIAGRDGPDQRILPALAIAFTEPNLVEVGTRFVDLPDGARVATSRVSDDARSQIDGHEEGMVRLYADADGLLIGATIVAAEGEHLGHVVALAIDRGISAADFADQAWYHPTVEEMLQDAARQLRDG